MSQQTLFNISQKEFTSDDHYTPKWIFDRLQITFDIDVAAPTGGCYWIPAKQYYDQQTNGLTSDWYGNVFMNPPFSKTTPWVEKFIHHANGIALLPMSKSKWFNPIWNNADGVVILPYDMTFVKPNNKRGSIFNLTLLFAFGKNNVDALHNIGRVR